MADEYSSDSYYDEEDELVSMSLGDHLEELRFRLIRAFIGIAIGVVISLVFGGYLFDLIFIPYQLAMKAAELDPAQGGMITTKPADIFLVYLKTSLMAGLLLSSFWVFYQGWSFVSAGLYRKEKKFVKVVSPISATLFICGAAFFLFVVAPLALQFFIKFNVGANSDIIKRGIFNLSDYVSFMLMLALVFGLGFQMPIAIVFANLMGLVSVKQLAAARKFFIIGLVFIAAVVTPPDVISQLSLAIPLYVLYEISIIVCRMRKKKKDEDKKPGHFDFDTPADD